MSQIYFQTPSERRGRDWPALGVALGLLAMSVMTVLAGETAHERRVPSGMQAAFERCGDEPFRSGDCAPEEPRRSGPRL